MAVSKQEKAFTVQTAEQEMAQRVSNNDAVVHTLLRLGVCSQEQSSVQMACRPDACSSPHRQCNSTLRRKCSGVK